MVTTSITTLVSSGETVKSSPAANDLYQLTFRGHISFRIGRDSRGGLQIVDLGIAWFGRMLSAAVSYLAKEEIDFSTEKDSET